MDGFARRKEQSKAEIRKAAWELFSQFGVDKVSIADIARRAGVSHGTIYNNFGSKDALAHEFVVSAVEQLVASAQAVLSGDKPFSEKMADFVQFITGMLADTRPTETVPPVFDWSVALQEDPDIKRIRDFAKERMTELLLAVVQEGKAQGILQSDISDEAFAIYFSAFMDLFVDSENQTRFRRNPDLAQEVGSLMIKGLCGVR